MEVRAICPNQHLSPLQIYMPFKLSREALERDQGLASRSDLRISWETLHLRDIFPLGRPGGRRTPLPPKSWRRSPHRPGGSPPAASGFQASAASPPRRGLIKCFFLNAAPPADGEMPPPQPPCFPFHRLQMKSSSLEGRLFLPWWGSGGEQGDLI